MDLLVGILTILVAATVYFLPTAIGFYRKHHNRLAIFALNLILGWTFIFWVAALVWALTEVKKTSTNNLTS